MRHLLYDGHGSTRALASSAGSVTDRYDYDAYGVVLGGNSTSQAPAATNLLYSGEQFDAQLAMGYNRARYYDMAAATWNRLDPYAGNHSDPQSLHKYAYCHGDPVNGVDPSGEAESSLVGQLAVQSVIGFLSTAVGTAASQMKRHGRIKWGELFFRSLIGALFAMAGGQVTARIASLGLAWFWSALLQVTSQSVLTVLRAWVEAALFDGSTFSWRDLKPRLVATAILSLLVAGYIESPPGFDEDVLPVASGMLGWAANLLGGVIGDFWNVCREASDLPEVERELDGRP